MAKNRDLIHRQTFEQQGETYVRKLAEQHKGQEIGHEAAAWLGEQQSLRDEAAATKRDEREEKTLKLAEDANSIARQARSDARAANKIAITAAIFAAIATICAAIIAVIFTP